MKKLFPNKLIVLLTIMLVFASCQSTQQLSCPDFKNRPSNLSLVNWKKEKKPLTRWVKTKQGAINKQERKPLRKVVERLWSIPPPNMIQSVKPSLISLPIKKGFLFRPKVALKEQDLQHINTEKQRFSKPNIFLPKKVHTRANTVRSDSVWADSISAPLPIKETLVFAPVKNSVRADSLRVDIMSIPSVRADFISAPTNKSPNQELLPVKLAFPKKAAKKNKEKTPLTFAEKLAFGSLIVLVVGLLSIFIPYFQLGVFLIITAATILGVCSMLLGAERYKLMGFISAGLGGLLIGLSLGLGLTWLIVAFFFWHA